MHLSFLFAQVNPPEEPPAEEAPAEEALAEEAPAEEAPAEGATAERAPREELPEPSRAPISYGPSAAEWLDCASEIKAVSFITWIINTVLAYADCKICGMIKTCTPDDLRHSIEQCRSLV